MQQAVHVYNTSFKFVVCRLEKYVQWRSFNIASERLILPSACTKRALRRTTWPANNKLLSQTRITFQYKLLSVTGLNIPADGVYITLNRCRFVLDIRVIGQVLPCLLALFVAILWTPRFHNCYCF